MQTKPQSRVISLFNRIFKIRYWSDSDRVKGFFHYICEMFKRLFVVRPKQEKESFEVVKTRLNLTDEALLKKQRALFRLSLLMVVFAVLMLCSTVYQCFHGTVTAIFLSLVVSLLAGTFAFRYHFWYFQIRQKKLGCSLGEWFYQGLLGRTRA